MIRPSTFDRFRPCRRPEGRTALRPLLVSALALAMATASACGGSSPGSERLTREKAAELIRADAKFAQPIEAGGKPVATRALLELTGLTQGTGPGLDSGEAEAEFTYRWNFVAGDADRPPTSALPPEAVAELTSPTPLRGKAALRRFDDGWHVMRYRNLWLAR